jgi:hypothetical protein
MTIEWPTVEEIAADLRAAQEEIPAGGWVELGEDDDEDNHSTDVRLQVYPDGQWALRTGDSSYDHDHRGYWGAGWLTHDTDCDALAADLLAEAQDHHAQCEE